MSLGTYEQPVRMQGDKFPAQDNQNKPLIVVAREFIENAKTKHSPEGKPAIRVDVADLLLDTVYVDALWMSGAVVDGLRPHIGTGTPLPVEIKQVIGTSGNPYLTLMPLVDQARQLAEGWYAKNPGRIDQERAKREAEAKPLGNVAPPADSPTQQTQTPAPQAEAPAPAATNGASPAPEAAPVTEAPAASMNDDAVAAALARLNS